MSRPGAPGPGGARLRALHLGPAAALLSAALAACVLPSTQASIRDILARTPTPGPAPAAAATAPPGTSLTITHTPVPGTGAPAPAPSGGATGAGRLEVEADLNVGTPTFAVQALPPGFNLARFQLTGASGQTARIGDLAVNAGTGRGTASVLDLPPGTYSVLVVALESGGLVVASGTASTLVPAGGTASASVKVESASRQRVRIDLPAGEIPTPSFTVSASRAGGAA